MGKKLSPRQIAALREYADTSSPLIVSILLPWGRQIKDSLVKRGLLRRDVKYLGVCYITKAGRAAILDANIQDLYKL